MTIGNSVKSIGSCTFGNCSSLTSVEIPDSVTSIGTKAFDGCTGLTRVTIGDSVTTIGAGAFNYCSSLTSVTIPNSVITIGKYAFHNCSKLTSVVIPDGVKSISEGTFRNCSSLENVTIPDSVTSIGNMAFNNCSILTSVTIPADVTSIGQSAFNGCSSLTIVNYKGTQDQWNGITFGSFNNYLKDANINYNAITVTSDNVSTEISKLTEGGSYTIIVTGEISDATISAINTALSGSNAKVNLDLSGTTGLKEIVGSAFFGCKSLTSVTIPNSVESINDSAFGGCSSLTRFIVSTNNPNYSSSDDGKILYNKDKTKLIAYPSATDEVTIDNSVTEIGSYAFNGCEGLTNVIIPNSVTSIGEGAFNGCDSLTTVNYKGTQEQWNGITFGSGNDKLTGADIKYIE